MAKFCTSCGAPLDEGQKFCTSCGAQVGAAQVNAQAQPQAGAQPQYTGVGEQKSKIAAGLLAIFLGAFGVHNFYLGFTGKAIAQLLISVLSCGIFAVVSSVWGLIEGIMILTGSITTDANGVPLKD